MVLRAIIEQTLQAIKNREIIILLFCLDGFLSATLINRLKSAGLKAFYNLNFSPAFGGLLSLDKYSVIKDQEPLVVES